MRIAINRHGLQISMIMAASLLFTGCGSSSSSASPSLASGAAPDLQVHALAAVTSPPCATGSVITAVTPNAGYAMFGTAFSTTMYNSSITSGNTTDNPQESEINVSLNGVPQAGCAVTWTPTNGTASGWVFPDNTVTDTAGNLKAWWTAGTAAQQSLTVSIARADGTTSSTSISGLAYADPSNPRSDSIYLNWSSTTWDQTSVDVTPVSTPPATTFYEAIAASNMYTGIQMNAPANGVSSGQVIFSIWAVPVNGVLTNPTVINASGSTCSSFGGEGTGIHCLLPYVPQAGVTYHFDLISAPVGSSSQQDYSVYFTDKSTGITQLVATLRLPVAQTNSGGSSFIEDWSTYATSCLSQAVRNATLGNIQYLDHATQQWYTVQSGWATPVYSVNTDEVCTNYQFTNVNNVFTLSTGGMVVGTAPTNEPGAAANVPLNGTAAPLSTTAPTPTAGPFSTGLSVIVDQGANGNVLDVYGGGTTAGSLIDAYSETDNTNQQWSIVQVSPTSNAYYITSVKSGLVLAVENNSNTPGTNIVLATPNNSVQQQWTITEVSANKYEITNVSTNLSLDIAGESQVPGSYVLGGNYSGSATQLWSFKHF